MILFVQFIEVELNRLVRATGHVFDVICFRGQLGNDDPIGEHVDQLFVFLRLSGYQLLQVVLKDDRCDEANEHIGDFRGQTKDVNVLEHVATARSVETQAQDTLENIITSKHKHHELRHLCSIISIYEQQARQNNLRYHLKEQTINVYKHNHIQALKDQGYRANCNLEVIL